MRRVLKLTALAAALLFLSVQFVRPDRTNPRVDQAQSIESHLGVTPEVASIFARACKDCHSNQTRWPWYSQVAPISWYVTDHVKHGRKHLNFSAWSRYDREQADFLLGAMCMTAERGTMPLPSYTQMHHSAKLSSKDVRTLCAWTQAARASIAQR